jgi:hypothetical protein
MAIGSYLPSHDKERVAWFKNFIDQFTLYAGTFNFSQNEIEGIRNDCIMFTELVDAVTVLKYGSKKGTGQKNLPEPKDVDIAPSLSKTPSAATNVPAYIFRRLSFTIRKIKNHESYTESLGLALGIIEENRSMFTSGGGITQSL